MIYDGLVKQLRLLLESIQKDDIGTQVGSGLL